MSDTFRDMNEINETSENLIKQLERFIDWAKCEISYHDYLEICDIQADFRDTDGELIDGEELDNAMNNAQESPLWDEINDAVELIKTLKKFVIKK